jgi:hypothetical protein
MPFSRAAGSDRRIELTSAAQRSKDRGDPYMSLQSTAALGSSPLHAGGGDGSSLEETLVSTTLRHLIRLSFRSCLAISFSLCYFLHFALGLCTTA